MNELPEIRLYRLIMAFSALQSMRVVVLDRVADLDPNYLAGAEECLKVVSKRLMSGSDAERELAQKVGDILYPQWRVS